MARAMVATEKGEAARLLEIDEEEFFEGSGGDEAVDLDVLFSSVNFKDGLALTGRPGVLREWPLVPGIDIVGRVTESRSSRFAAGDLVVLNGDGIGENRHGGFATKARVRPDALLHLPEAISPERAAAIGTAGFTSMLAVLALQDAGVEPDDGEVLVTGAAGGVGSVAILLLAGRGYSVVASSGRVEEQGDYLRSLGAARVVDRAALGEPGKPLQSQQWAGAVDSVGSHTLANVLAQTNYGGTVVACGLAAGGDLPTTVMPFILRSVTLTGANSVEAPLALRERAWTDLANELDLALLDSMTTTIGLDAVSETAERILAGRVRGRTVVDVAL
ncbi:MDR family oxidoreductase [Herbiconiux sp. KACC 21604]|uniref:MDR family oxidoreductase n=1 Tax=unclassified Herbiconiux TaxID=2618217 RepID=UPI001490C7C1|nr:MDR family oxidoreductase [Herbiconiux sp. SALV-R1]QJU55525.1 oxidoreductase [Herbiconiux sp. SALV-R1]WPO86710.1 MDR family oxidoreductase [Herbiconiux sp. KACC 21604]